MRRALLQLAPKARWTRRALRAAAVLKSFTLTFSPDGKLTAGLDVDALAGAADSGALSEDLSDLLVAVGDAAAEQGVGVVLLLDEIQFLKSADLEALIVALHKCARRSLPITLVGAGLPQIPRLAGEAKSYSERLFRFVRSAGSTPRAMPAMPSPFRRASWGSSSNRRPSTWWSSTRRATRSSCRNTAASSGTRHPPRPSASTMSPHCCR